MPEEAASARLRPSSTPSWLSAFIDVPADVHEATLAFWEGVTGFARSQPRGADDEFVTLLPPRGSGDDYLRVQRVASGPARLHLDVHVADPVEATAYAAGLGAAELHRTDDHIVLRSPGGFVFCFVSHPGSRVPPPATWPGVRRSRVYQVCLDIPAPLFAEETAFWAALTGRVIDPFARRDEYTWLRAPEEDAPLALDLLLQRLDESDGDVRAHLDSGSPDRAAEVARHEALGARTLSAEPFWTVLSDPAGLAYCVTDRDPATGSLV